MDITITRYRSLYDTRPASIDVVGWNALVAQLSTSVPTPDKFSVGGFGAHVLIPGSRRAAAQVESVTLLVFDVDAGTVPQVAQTEQRLRDASLSAHFYSSHSHTPEKPALRLLVPISRPLLPREYSKVRADFIARFAVPCKPEQSGDVSRFWFLPSHRPGTTPLFETLVGNPYDVGPPPPAQQRPEVTAPIALPNDWAPPRADTTALHLGGLRDRVSRRITSLRRHKDGARADILQRVLDGVVLAEHGSRNTTTLSACGMLAFVGDIKTPLEAYLALLRPSLYAMQAAGSKLTESDVERMLATAMRKRATSHLQVEEFVRRCLEMKAAVLARSRNVEE